MSLVSPQPRSAAGTLPLLVRAKTDAGEIAYITPRRPSTGASPAPGEDVRARMPQRGPGVGEQYRFHFDMRKCIGCKCCVVACNEQNGNPASINWRRVGELEGGFFPQASKTFLSMGCNHCLEPTCLQGCPVDAYDKDPLTGIVTHSADACIGCQYCTWNCSYGVPQYNPERGVVGKCDMCHGRLAMGQAPACVSACPEGAIEIEIVRTADWRAAVAAAVDVGVPSSDHSLSTTRVSVPAHLPPNTRPRDITHVVPEHAHVSLIVMTVLTQLSVGGFVAIWLLQLLGGSTGLGRAALMSLAVGSLALGAATLHLGRPAHAYRALRMWRRSWLSREVLLFSAFSAVAALYAAVLWFGISGGSYVGAFTALLGIAGVVASGCIYRVPARPAWNTPYTLVEFALTAAILGPLFALATAAGEARWLAFAAPAAAGAQFVLLALRFFRCVASDSLELRGTARLLATVLAPRVVVRGLLLAAGAIVLPLVTAATDLDVSAAASVQVEAGVDGLVTRAADLPAVASADMEAGFDEPAMGLGGFSPVASAKADAGVEESRGLLVGALLLALAGELLGRYLFFTSVVPRHLAAPYVAAASEAA